MSEPNYYEILQVSPLASADEIRRAYRRRIAEVHPDRPGVGDPELARALDEARSVLLDPVARARYDAARASEELLDETFDALTEIGNRALERLALTLEVRGREVLGSLRIRARAKSRGAIHRRSRKP